MQREKNLSSPSKKKNTEHPGGYSALGTKGNVDLNLAPCELQMLFAFGTACNVVLRPTLTEQLCLPRWRASSPTRLCCVICAPRAFGLRRCADGKSFHLRQKEKIRNTRVGIPYFWRRRKDLNLRAGYPTYTLSRGASSPLEYFSI